MSITSLNFDKLPDSTEFEEKEYELKIIRAETLTASTGTVMIQCDYAIKETSQQVRFDNYPLSTPQGNPSTFGLAKLKKLIKAVGLKPAGDFTPQTLCTMLMNKEFVAVVGYEERNEKKFLRIKDIDSMVPKNTTASVRSLDPMDAPVEEQMEFDFGETNWE